MVEIEVLRIQQVVINLLDNAIHSLRDSPVESPCIHIRTETVRLPTTSGARIDPAALPVDGLNPTFPANASAKKRPGQNDRGFP